jgi:hypothetical protein
MTRKGGLNVLESRPGALFWAAFFFQFVVLVENDLLVLGVLGVLGVFGVLGVLMVLGDGVGGVYPGVYILDVV